MPRSSLPLMPVMLLVAGCAGESPVEESAATTVDKAHLQEVEQWRQERRTSLEQPDGWFSLVGLFWLEQPESTCGSDPSSAVRLPDSAPARAGVFRMSDGGVEFEANPDAGVLVDGQVTTRGVAPEGRKRNNGPEGDKRNMLATDVEGEPTVIEVGSIKLYLIDRGGRIGVRVKDSQSPALLAFDGLENFAVDPQWRTEARFVPYDPPRQIAVPTVLGTIAEQPSPGAVEFELAAASHRLDVLSGGDEEYFIVFGDASNGKQTYGGGRFLSAVAADEAGRVVLDFNQAYNPPCAFTPYATCPLPPRQNRLALAVHAGEKNYAGGIEH